MVSETLNRMNVKKKYIIYLINLAEIQKNTMRREIK